MNSNSRLVGKVGEAIRISTQPTPEATPRRFPRLLAHKTAASAGSLIQLHVWLLWWLLWPKGGAWRPPPHPVRHGGRPGHGWWPRGALDGSQGSGKAYFALFADLLPASVPRPSGDCSCTSCDHAPRHKSTSRTENRNNPAAMWGVVLYGTGVGGCWVVLMWCNRTSR